jgi:tetratricopeptide (TPR) repeat protein
VVGRATRERALRFAACLFVALATAWLFAPITGFDFIGLDDPFHVTGNPAVRSGLSLASVRSAFEPQAGYFIPLTWLSHTLDVELFGLDAGAHHRTNLWLHALNAALACLWLARASGHLAPALACAALFALHPLRVESVAWIAERKDLLSGLFCFCALLAWDRYRARGTRAAFACAILAWLASLAAKPIAVTLPLLLLALDYWPYARLRRLSELRPLLREKLVLFGIALAAAAMTIATQSAVGALGELGGLDVALGVQARAANALVSIAHYVSDSVWPHALAPLYPHPSLPGGAALSAAEVSIAGALVAAISTLAWLLRRRAPAAIAGWIWFLVALLPVLGLIQSGVQARADRFTYLPQLGLFAALVFPLAEHARGRRGLGISLALCAALASAALARATRAELPHWRDAETLYRHGIERAPNSGLLHIYFGLWLEARGRAGEALVEYAAAERIPAYAPSALLNRGMILERLQRPVEALAAFERAFALVPDFEPARRALADALARRGEIAAARAVRTRTPREPAASAPADAMRNTAAP